MDTPESASEVRQMVSEITDALHRIGDTVKDRLMLEGYRAAIDMVRRSIALYADDHEGLLRFLAGTVDSIEPLERRFWGDKEGKR